MSQKSNIPTKLEWIDVSLINIDPTYQRAEVRAWIKKTASSISRRSLVVLVISQREDGSYWAIDGQQRAAAVRLGGDPHQKVLCLVYRGLSRQEEAELFTEIQDRTGHRYADRFRSRCAAGQDIPVAIEHIAKECGFTIDESNTDGSIKSPLALERIYTGWRSKIRRLQPDVLRAVLQTQAAAWGRSADQIFGVVLSALGLIFQRYGSAVDCAHLIRRLSMVSGGPGGLIGKGRGLMAARPSSRLPEAIAEVVVTLYNKGRRTSILEDWRS